MKRSGLLSVIATIFLFVTFSSAETPGIKLPETAPGKLMTEWLSMCSAPNLEQMTKWSAEHYSDQVFKFLAADKLAQEDLKDCSESGGYRAGEVTDTKPDRMKLLAVANKTGAWFTFNLVLNKEEKIDGFNLGPAAPPEAALPKDLSDAAIVSDLNSYADKMEKAGLFSGILMLARDGKPILTRAEGYADRANKTPFTPSSQFTIGSMGKMFTAAAIGQLVDRGKLSYDDVVGKFFPDYANKTVREKVTVGMLLSHTAGLKDFLGKRTPEMMKNGVKRAAEFVPLFEKDELRFEPGTSWGYSNAGLALAGAIVEKVSGEDYPTYIRKRIFDPAGMKDSDPNNIPGSRPHLVVPYTHMSHEGPTPEWHEAEHDIGSPAGGAISTVADLVRFADALRSGKLVSKATFEKMVQPHGKTPGGGIYGYAMEIQGLYGQTVVGHSGGFPGVSTHLYMVLGSPYTVVVLANQDPPAADFLGERGKALMVAKAKKEK
ncbi:MAG: serine hydrolase domain-containing protein [Candidatus Angelobacter sp.]